MIGICPPSHELLDHASDISEEEKHDQGVKGKSVPVLLTSHLNNYSLRASRRCICLMHFFGRRVNYVALVFELAVRIYHHSMSLDCYTLDPLYLVALTVQILDTVQQALSVSLFQL